VSSRCLTLALFTALAAVTPSPARAQVYETAGIRAQGMGGAFLAVADDATATWWNAAGLASGALLNGVFEYGQRDDDGQGTVGIALALPPLGLSYYRYELAQTHFFPPTGTSTVDRQDPGKASTRVPTTAVNQLGVTINQSFGDHLVAGSTVSLLRAEVTRGDIDVGAMVIFGSVRAAIVMKHVGEPDVTGGDNPEQLQRQVRVGFAYVPLPRDGRAINISIDADLRTTATALGNERHIAAGVEWWARRRLGVRGGFAVNTVDDPRPSLSAGVSAAVMRSVFVEAAATRAATRDQADRNRWGIGARVTF
jgi:hypothetical protein